MKITTSRKLVYYRFPIVNSDEIGGGRKRKIRDIACLDCLEKLRQRSALQISFLCTLEPNKNNLVSISRENEKKCRFGDGKILEKSENSRFSFENHGFH